jgi:integrase/recombinase XerD
MKLCHPFFMLHQSW